MSDINKLLGQFQKEVGDVARMGAVPISGNRVPTDVLAHDIATGGGYPRGRISVVWGNEGSLKTTMALKAIANAQKISPDKKCAFVDLEGHYDPAWGALLGVDNSKLIHVIPDFAEQTVDIVEALLYASDLDVVAIDSLAALITANEIDSSAEKAVVGGSGLVIGKLYRKMSLALNKARKAEREPTVIAINQVRQKIGVMHGCPDVMSGGNAFKFASSLTEKLYGKDAMEKKIHPTLPCYKHCTGTIQKKKVPTTAKTFEFDMAIIPIPSKGLEVGDTNDWGTLFGRLKDAQMLVKGKKAWVLEGEEYRVLEDLRTYLMDDYETYIKLRQQVIDYAIQGLGA